MEMLDLLGYLAGLFTTAANVPQVITTYKKRSGEGLSFRMLLVLAIGLALWIAYGVGSHSQPLIIFNGIALALVFSLIGMKLRFDRRPAKD
jgi:MtN3 and saliva related transmembrane protein